MSTHSPEPWMVAESPDEQSVLGIADANGLIVAQVTSPPVPPEEMGENARRIVACVHACTGIPTETLEAGVVGVPVGEIESWLTQLSEALLGRRYGDSESVPLTNEQRLRRVKEVHAALFRLHHRLQQNEQPAESRITVTIDVQTYRGYRDRRVIEVEPGLGWADRLVQDVEPVAHEMEERSLGMIKRSGGDGR